MPFGPKKKTLNPKHQKFAAEWVRTGVASAAAIAAGYNPRHARQEGHRLLKNPFVQEEINRLREEITESGKYNYEKAMSEALEAMKFAKATSNANAYVRAVEHRAKLSGLMIEKVDVRAAVGFQIKITGIDDAPILPNSEREALAPKEGG